MIFINRVFTAILRESSYRLPGVVHPPKMGITFLGVEGSDFVIFVNPWTKMVKSVPQVKKANFWVGDYKGLRKILPHWSRWCTPSSTALDKSKLNFDANYQVLFTLFIIHKRVALCQQPVFRHNSTVGCFQLISQTRYFSDNSRFHCVELNQTN